MTFCHKSRYIEWAKIWMKLSSSAKFHTCWSEVPAQPHMVQSTKTQNIHMERLRRTVEAAFSLDRFQLFVVFGSAKPKTRHRHIYRRHAVDKNKVVSSQGESRKSSVVCFNWRKVGHVFSKCIGGILPSGKPVENCVRTLSQAIQRELSNKDFTWIRPASVDGRV